MALEIEGVVDGGVKGEEAQELTFSPPDRLMRDLASVVQPQALDVVGRETELGEHCAIGPEAVGGYACLRKAPTS